MSYCRFSDSDAYIFGHAEGGYECCGCSLSPHSWFRKFKTIFGVLFHCLRHSLTGHHVPKRTYKLIIKEIFRFKWTNPPLNQEKNNHVS